MGKRPKGVAYEDAACLCQWLSTIRLGVPAHIRLVNFRELADAFTKLSKIGWIHSQQSNKFFGDADNDLITSRDHWLEVMVRRFKQPDRTELARGEQLAKELGFE
jgi:hypothetical protein